jgi:ankyrin repeat protein
MMSGKKVSQAIKRGERSLLAAALAEGADPNGVSDAGLPFLCSACEQGDPVLVAMLLESGADVNVECGDGDRPLHVNWINARRVASKSVIVTR